MVATPKPTFRANCQAAPGAVRFRRARLATRQTFGCRSLNPRWSVSESVIEGLMNYGVPRAEAMSRAKKLMVLVRLDPNSPARYPHQFSGGQRQRICIARAVAMEPQPLIADETVSALDVSVQAQVLARLDEIRDRLDLAMLFITRDLRVAAQVCGHVAVMSQGKVVE
jgi:peptide/nickel transport system ATP-binding protein